MALMLNYIPCITWSKCKPARTSGRHFPFQMTHVRRPYPTHSRFLPLSQALQSKRNITCLWFASKISWSESYHYSTGEYWGCTSMVISWVFSRKQTLCCVCYRIFVTGGLFKGQIWWTFVERTTGLTYHKYIVFEANSVCCAWGGGRGGCLWVDICGQGGLLALFCGREGILLGICFLGILSDVYGQGGLLALFWGRMGHVTKWVQGICVGGLVTPCYECVSIPGYLVTGFSFFFFFFSDRAGVIQDYLLVEWV